MFNKMKSIWIDGKLVPWDDAKIHVMNTGLHYGWGVFEGIRAYECVDGRPAVFRIREHMQRLIDSCKILMMDYKYSLDELCQGTIEVLRDNNLKECYIRPIIFEGEGGMGLIAYNPVNVVIAAWPWPSYLGDGIAEKGAKVKVSSFSRHHPNVGMVRGKICGQYVNSGLAKRDAKKDGFDEAIMLDTCGYVCEATAENIFAVRDNVIYTPPLSSSILNGITRDTLITLARESGYEVREQTFQRDFLYIADEVFFCGTAVELMPVREIDFRPIGEGKPGPVARKLKDLYFKLLRGGLDTHKEWLTYY